MDQSLNIAANGQTDIGQVRSTNQDSLLLNNDANLFIVADGMGGHAGGEIASKLCVEYVDKFLNNDSLAKLKGPHPNTTLLSELANAVNFASSKIYEKALEQPSLKGMGTTATVLKIIDDHAYFAHVGDSRLYLVRKGFIYQVTHDHSLVNEQVRAGILSPEEAELHHLRNVITRSVGYQEEEDVDTSCFKLENDDVLLMSSDGLHGKVSNKEITKSINSHDLQSVSGLIQLANERGGDDNITVIVVKIQVFGK